MCAGIGQVSGVSHQLDRAPTQQTDYIQNSRRSGIRSASCMHGEGVVMGKTFPSCSTRGTGTSSKDSHLLMRS